LASRIICVYWPGISLPGRRVRCPKETLVVVAAEKRENDKRGTPNLGSSRLPACLLPCSGAPHAAFASSSFLAPAQGKARQGCHACQGQASERAKPADHMPSTGWVCVDAQMQRILETTRAWMGLESNRLEFNSNPGKLVCFFPYYILFRPVG
jgi:hypothetical protein